MLLSNHKPKPRIIPVLTITPVTNQSPLQVTQSVRRLSLGQGAREVSATDGSGTVEGWARRRGGQMSNTMEEIGGGRSSRPAVHRTIEMVGEGVHRLGAKLVEDAGPKDETGMVCLSMESRIQHRGIGLLDNAANSVGPAAFRSLAGRSNPSQQHPSDSIRSKTNKITAFTPPRQHAIGKHASCQSISIFFSPGLALCGSISSPTPPFDS